VLRFRAHCIVLTAATLVPEHVVGGVEGLAVGDVKTAKGALPVRLLDLSKRRAGRQAEHRVMVDDAPELTWSGAGWAGHINT
jgi:hypothetical protein